MGTHLFRIWFLLVCSSATGAGYIIGQECPAPSAIHHYVDTKVQSEYPPEYGGRLRLYYSLIAPYCPSKPTILIIVGGPGSLHRPFFEETYGFLKDKFNVVGFDHRGTGCTKILSETVPFYLPGMFAMRRAAEDIETIRRDLLGPDGSWHVYGVSYGGMLAQQYVTRFPSHVQSLILDSTFHQSAAMGVARDQFVSLFVDGTPEVKPLFEQVCAKYTDARNPVLRYLMANAYSLYGRTVASPKFLRQILEAKTYEEAKAIYGAQVTYAFEGMYRSILCEEIYDYPAVASPFYWFDVDHECRYIKTFRNPMNFSSELQNLRVRTMLWSGAFDPVTPNRAMQAMQQLLPQSLLYENKYSGHALINEKKACVQGLAKDFFSGASDAQLQLQMQSELCQSPPVLPESARAYERRQEQGQPWL